MLPENKDPLNKMVRLRITQSDWDFVEMEAMRLTNHYRQINPRFNRDISSSDILRHGLTMYRKEVEGSK